MYKVYAMKINDMHRAVLQDYANGAFAHLTKQDTVNLPHELDDDLLIFILMELSTDEGCDSLEEGIHRIERARDDLDVCLTVLKHLQSELQSRATHN